MAWLISALTRPNPPRESSRRGPALRLVVAVVIATLLSASVAIAKRQQQHLQELNKALMEGAKKGDFRAVESALGKGADPNAYVAGIWEYFTPLTLATTEGHLRIVELLLDYSADPYAEDQNHDPAIVFAAEKKKEKILKLYLSRGVPIDQRDSEGRTALERIIVSEQVHPSVPEDIELLIQLGADPNQRTSDGGSLLMTAVLSDARRSLTTLARHGVDINARDEDGNSALLHAVHQSRDECIKYLLKIGADVNAQNKHGDTALLLAVHWHSSVPDLILQYKPNVNIADIDGNTPLMKAVEGAPLNRVEAILDRGADVKARNKEGKTAVHFAAAHIGWMWKEPDQAVERETQLKIIPLLESKGADLKTVTNDGRSALHFAAEKGYPGMLRLLIEKGGDVRAADYRGDMPLHYAIRSHVEGKMEKLKLLIHAGVNAPNKNGDTPLLLTAAAMDRAACSLLVGSGASVDIVNSKGETPLLLAASSFNRQYVEPADYIEMVRSFAEKSSGIDTRDSKMMTAAMWAAASNVPQALEAVLAKGADIKARSADGRTCLMWAASTNATRTIQLLIDRGADIKAKDNDGRTAADWARSMGYDATVRELEKRSASK